MFDTASTSSTPTLALDDLRSSAVSEPETRWDIGQLDETLGQRFSDRPFARAIADQIFSARPTPPPHTFLFNELAATSQAVRNILSGVFYKLADIGVEATTITEVDTAVREEAISKVEALRSQVGERLWADSGKPLALRTVDWAVEFVKKCPVESFRLDMFNIDFTADGDVLLDWDDGGVPALTILVTQDGSIVHSGAYKESQGKRRSHKGTEPWDGTLSRELRQAFRRLLDERAA